MFDLIWIGNTLYPRWFVLAFCIFIILIVVGGISLIAWLLK